MLDGADVIPFTGLRAGSSGGSTMTEIIEFAGTAGLAGLADHLEPSERRAADVTPFAAPIPLPGAIVAAPINYIDHKVEMSSVTDIRSLGMFLKARSSVTGPGSVIRLPYVDRRFDHEGELGVVIGRETADVDRDEALDAVFGYTCLLDITMRGGEDRSTRKSFRTFTPIGPWIATADEVGDPAELRVRCRVNGEERQNAPTSEMVWSVRELIAYTSTVMTLYPGDVIASGTPVGVGPIGDGDTVEVEIDRIGMLSVSVSSDGAVSCPTSGAGAGPVPPPPR
jgi:2-keto-4-pentenoate hydratase/2-oxohepta-3-ene-1,7-dioic acid hydratase in catechol pathway